MSRTRISMDIGGTFTDVVAYDEASGTYRAGKAATTPADLTEGVLDGIGQLTGELGDIGFCVHGTTQGLNAFLQRRGERVLLLATRGAGDVYHVARGNRTRLYDIHYRKPQPLVPRRDIVEIGGRLDWAGQELEPLDEDAVRAAAARAREEGFGAIAVAFLFSYVNPAHEQRAAEILRAELPGVTVSASHGIAREWREYERTSSTVVDAYTAPVVRRYLVRLEDELRGRGLGVPLHVMQSSGGIVTAESAREQTLQTLLSGPVGATLGGVALARLLGRPNLICVDMGGTSFDVSLVVDGQPDVSTEAELEGFPLMIPVVDIHTIGAGGGSIAYSEAGGLRVGPESAGAVPGPACYGRGGERPTVTDADLVLGRVDPDAFAGGTMTLDRAAAERAVETLAAELGLQTAELAEGICDVVNAKMAQAIRTLTVEKGIAPGDFALVACGGAGPMHAAFLARELGIAETIVPRFPGAFSAWGMLETEVRRDASRTFFSPLDEVDADALARELHELDAEGAAALGAEGIEGDAGRVLHALDLRYIGQEYSLTIPLESLDEPLAGTWPQGIADRFHTAHRNRFGHANPRAPIEVVVLRMTALGSLGRTQPRPLERVDSTPTGDVRPVVFDRATHDAPVVDRVDLGAGSAIDGPVIVTEPTATTVVPPGMRLTVDDFGNLVLRDGESAA